MTHTTALLRRTERPHIADMADAIHMDAATLAAEWSRGDDLSMISAGTVTTENTSRILLLASVAALKDAGESAMAQLVEAYLSGHAAAMQFANRDHRTDRALEDAASDLEALAEEVAAGFRAEMMESAA